jgi:hypothetical protein
MIRDNISVTDLDIDLFIPTDLGYTAYDADKDYVFIQVARGIDHHELKGIMIILDLDGVSHSARVVAPGPNEAKSCLFKVDSYTNNGAEPLESVHAKVAPIFLLNKQERIGETTGEVEVPKKAITSDAEQEILEGKVTLFEINLTDEEEEFLDIQEGCPSNKEADGMGGCAVGVGDYFSKSPFI